MLNFLFWLFILSIPFIFLLFFSSSKKIKVVYSHFLLKQNETHKFKSRLSILFLLYYDLLFDFLIIIVISLILSNINIFHKKEVAFVIDSSYSIKQKSLKKFYNYLKTKNGFNKDIFILSYDSKIGKNKLYNVRGKLPHDNFSNFYLFINNNFIHFNNDYNNIYKLFTKLKQKYKKIIFLTDYFPFTIYNIDIYQSGFDSTSIFYPVNIYYNIFTKQFEIYFINTISNIPFSNDIDIQLFSLEDDYNKLKPFNNYKIIMDNPDKLKIIIGEEGYYLLKEGNLNFIINLEYPALNIISHSKFTDNFKIFFANKNINSEIKDKTKKSINLYYYDFKNNLKLNISNKQSFILFIKTDDLWGDDQEKVIAPDIFYYYLDPEITDNNYGSQIYFKSLIFFLNKNNFQNYKSRFLKNFSNLEKTQNLENILVIDENFSKSLYFPVTVLNLIYKLNLDSISNNNITKTINQKLKLIYDGTQNFIYKFNDTLIIKNLAIDEFIKPIYLNKKFIIHNKNNSKILFIILLILIFVAKFYFLFKTQRKNIV